MPNMSYCRFENTANDLQDCVDALDECMGELSSLSKAEERAARRIIELAKAIVDDYGELAE